MMNGLESTRKRTGPRVESISKTDCKLKARNEILRGFEHSNEPLGNAAQMQECLEGSRGHASITKSSFREDRFSELLAVPVFGRKGHNYNNYTPVLLLHIKNSSGRC